MKSYLHSLNWLEENEAERPTMLEERPMSVTQHPYYKIVRHCRTGEVEIRRWWEIACRNHPYCEKEKSGCMFQHQTSAMAWAFMDQCHTKVEAEQTAWRIQNFQSEELCYKRQKH